MKRDSQLSSLPVLELVKSPRAFRKFTLVLLAGFALMPIILMFVPWQQNVPGQGRIVALDPLERNQTIPAPVTGRLVKVHVQEGQFVNQGDVLAEMSDQDPNYSQRLQQQFEFAQEKVRAARGQVTLYAQQLENLERSRELALDKAQFELNAAIEKVKVEERTRDEVEADLEQKRADRERKWKLFKEGLVSELDYQKAEAAFKAGLAKVEKAKAEVEAALNDEKAKLSDIGRIGNDLQAKIESTRSLREGAASKAAEAAKEETESLTKLERQKTQTVYAPKSGFIMRVHAASSADFLSQGEPLIELIPDTDALAVELWIRGNDAPLVTPGRKVRLQFEGWPAVQFAGWPSVAVGTFGGVVQAIDLQGRTDGRFRALIVPDPDDEPWPETMFLRQGARTNGWVLLENVRLGFELWRQLNAFPPRISYEPDAKTSGKGASKPKTKGDSK